MSAQEMQQCINACLAGAGGDPNSAAYEACFLDRCSGAEPPAAEAGPPWRFDALDPADPPYLSGGVASVRDLADAWRLRIACTGEGWSLALDPPQPSIGGWEFDFVVDGRSAGRQISTAYEGADQLRADDGLIGALAAGNGLELVRNGTVVARFSLAGSSAALGSTAAACP
jgi:hypothetical protein